MTNPTATRVGSLVATPVRELSQTVPIDQITVLTVVVLSVMICSGKLKDLSDIPLLAGGRGQDSWPLAGVPTDLLPYQLGSFGDCSIEWSKWIPG